MLSIRSQWKGRVGYPLQVGHFFELKHHYHSSFEKSSIIERTIQYIKDKIEGFDYCFPFRKKKEMQTKTCKEMV